MSLTNWQISSFRSGIAAIVLLASAVRRLPRFSVPALLVGAAYGATVITFITANQLTTGREHGVLPGDRAALPRRAGAGPARRTPAQTGHPDPGRHRRGHGPAVPGTQRAHRHRAQPSPGQRDRRPQRLQLEPRRCSGLRWLEKRDPGGEGRRAPATPPSSATS
ncbi:MAG: hypothetical protein MZV64_73165 [Ignavibacteriales bacterium]|nr:hypothetical protein [Ignavibacteriales bacterium]